MISSIIDVIYCTFSYTNTFIPKQSADHISLSKRKMHGSLVDIKWKIIHIMHLVIMIYYTKRHSL